MSTRGHPAATSSNTPPAGDALPPASPEQHCTLCMAVLFNLADAADGEEQVDDKTPPTRLAALGDLRWDSSNPLTISFLNGKPESKKKVMDYVQLWTQPGGANIKLMQIADNDKNADIRIRFADNNQWWSCMGNQSRYDAEHWDHQSDAAKKDNPERASMNLDIETETNEDAIRRHVVHEFGHALGFIHEHLRSDFPYKLDKKVAKKYYSTWPWETIKHNVLKTVPASPNVLLWGSGPDLDSIMIYPFPPGLLKKGPTIGWNTELSRLDIKYSGLAYPK